MRIERRPNGKNGCAMENVYLFFAVFEAAAAAVYLPCIHLIDFILYLVLINMNYTFKIEFPAFEMSGPASDLIHRLYNASIASDYVAALHL